MHNTDAPVLVLDVDGCYARDVVRCLAAARPGRFHVLSAPDSPARFCRYAIFHVLPRDACSDEYLMHIVEILRRRTSARVLLAVDEPAVAFIARQGRRLAARWALAPVPDPDVFDTVTDKARLATYLAKHELPHPRTESIHTLTDALSAAGRVGYPLLLKPPRGSSGGAGIRRVDSTAELRVALAAGIPRDGLLLQSFVEGHDVDCSVLCLDGTVLASTVQRPAIPPPTAYSASRAVHFVQDDGPLRVVRRVMAKLNFSGVAHVDMRRDRHAHDPYIIEINARFWGTLIASLAAGVNFPNLAVRLARGEVIDRITHQPITFAPYRELLASWLQGRPLGLARPWRVRTGLSFVVSDPGILLSGLRVKLSRFRFQPYAVRK